MQTDADLAVRGRTSMAKLSKEEQARRAGMAYALKIAKEKGIDGLEEELKRRGALNAPITLPQKELDAFTTNVKIHTIGTITTLAEYVLRNKFDFGNRGRNGQMGRMDKFKHWMNFYAESVVEDYLTIDDMVENLNEETGVDLWFKKNDRSVKV